MTGVPANILIPFVGVEFDSSRSSVGAAVVPVTLCVIGQRLSSGSVAEAVPFTAFSANEVAIKAGFGSMLHRQSLKVFSNNSTVPVVFIGLDDAATSTAATYEFTLSGTATKSGELVLYIAGQRYAVGVAIDDTAAVVAAALDALITEDTNNIQVSSSVATATITLTCKNKGIIAGDLDVRFNANDGELFPEGITVGSVTPTAGTVDPDVSDALSVIGGAWYNVMTQPYTDNTNMNLLEDHLDTVAGVMEQRDCVCYQALRDTRSNMITYGTDGERNNPWTVTLPCYGRMESVYELSAGVAAATAVSIQDDAAVPLHRMQLKGFTALSDAYSWTPTERNQLASNGIATLSDTLGVQTEATVTMYLKNSAGADDDAYQQQNTLFTLSALRYRFVNQILTKYPRAKLADSAEDLEPGQQIMTIDIGISEAVAWFKSAQRDGLVEPGRAALTQFKNELVVQRVGKNRMNWLLPPDLMNQFIVGSGVLQFRG